MYRFTLSIARRLRGTTSSGLALALLCLPVGCGRLGYDPLARPTVVDGAAAPEVRIPAGTAGPEATDAANPVPDARTDRADVAADSATVSVDSADSPIDGDVGATPVDASDGGAGDASGACPPAPADSDWIADFEAGVAATRASGQRVVRDFVLVNSGEGRLSIGAHPAPGLCGSRLFMSFLGNNITPGRGHIQALLRSSPAPSESVDARRYRGIRLRMRASAPIPVSLKVPDRHTVSSLPYDHFAILLEVTGGWQTFEADFAMLRQDGRGAPRPALDLAALAAIELQVMGASTFELWVDDIVFVP